MKPPHRLKTHPAPFDAIMRGEKTFEFRRDDRGFEEGDKVSLTRFDPEKGPDYTAPCIVADIGFLLRGPAFGIPQGYCVFSLLDPHTGYGPCVREATVKR